MIVLERMNGPGERLRGGPAVTLDVADVAALNVVAIEVAGENGAVALTPGRDDALFENDGQLTRSEIRALVLASLAPRYGERLWDIGLGSGSIAIEWLLADPSLAAIGIEERPDRAARARRNALALGAPALEIVEGRAPEALSGLPPPDAVFIGGGLGDGGVVETAWQALNPGGRLVANAVTLEGEVHLAKLAAAHGGNLTRLAIQRAEPLGKLIGWTPARPITHWRVVKR
jgi:precorrin-6Y C5,15-methyltransferase (decarboxylating)